LHFPVVSHVPEQWPLGSSWLETAAQAWVGPQRWQVPSQSLSAQQAATGMHAPLQAFAPAEHA
jgi:hypothetical protein